MATEIESRREKSKRFFKVLMLVSLVYFLAVSFLIFATYYLKVGYSIIHSIKTSLPALITIGCILYVSFMIVIISIYVDYRSFLKRMEERKKPKPLYYKGKRMYVYTYPEGAKGGIFTRTIIPVDEETVVNVRYQIVNARELWKS